MSSVSRRGRLAVSCVPGLVTASRQGLGPASASASPLEVGAVSCANGAELCLWQLTAKLLWYKRMYFMGLGDSCVLHQLQMYFGNTVPKHSTGPELAGFKSRLWEVLGSELLEG